MNAAQTIAHAHPCKYAEDTLHPRFRSVVGNVSRSLTANVGEE